MLDKVAYPLLVAGEVGRAKSVGLSDNGDQVNTGAQALHDLDIQGLQSVSSWADEVQARVHAHVNLVRSAGLLLLQHVRLMLVVKELDNRLPGIAVVDVVTKSGGINNGQANYTAQLLLASRYS